MRLDVCYQIYNANCGFLLGCWALCLEAGFLSTWQSMVRPRLIFVQVTSPTFSLKLLEKQNDPLSTSHFKGLNEITSNDYDILFAEDRSYYHCLYIWWYPFCPYLKPIDISTSGFSPVSVLLCLAEWSRRSRALARFSFATHQPHFWFGPTVCYRDRQSERACGSTNQPTNLLPAVRSSHPQCGRQATHCRNANCRCFVVHTHSRRRRKEYNLSSSCLKQSITRRVPITGKLLAGLSWLLRYRPFLS